MYKLAVGIPDMEYSLDKPLFIRLAVIYFACWLATFYEAPLGIRVALVAVMVFNQLLSFYNAIVFFLMALMIPFIADMFNDLVQGLDPYRFMFFPFLVYALTQKKIRNFPFNNRLYFFIFVSLVLLQASSAYQILVRNMPLTEENRPIDVLALVYDNAIKLAFLYFIFTRLGYKQLQSLLVLFVFLIVIEAVSLIHMTFIHKDLLYKISSDSILWINPYFGHKNEWSFIFVFIFLIALIRSLEPGPMNWFWYAAVGIIVLAIALSLSRQAYVWTIMALLITAFYKKNAKIPVYMAIGGLLLLIIQPAFLFERMEAMVSSSNTEEFQELNSKVGDEAINQLIDNFEIVPQMFVKEWEYNHSEGFWNGFLHQQGILGLLFIFYIYFFAFSRFRFFYALKHRLLTPYAIYGMVAIILMFLGNLNRRHTHFMHYKGEIGEIGLFVMFMILLSEVTYQKLLQEKQLHSCIRQ
jgi:hypothetical protein